MDLYIPWKPFLLLGIAAVAACLCLHIHNHNQKQLSRVKTQICIIGRMESHKLHQTALGVHVWLPAGRGRWLANYYHTRS